MTQVLEADLFDGIAQSIQKALHDLAGWEENIEAQLHALRPAPVAVSDSTLEAWRKNNDAWESILGQLRDLIHQAQADLDSLDADLRSALTAMQTARQSLQAGGSTPA